MPSQVWPYLPLRLAVLAAREVWRVVPGDTSISPPQLSSQVLLASLFLIVPEIFRLDLWALRAQASPLLSPDPLPLDPGRDP